MKQIRKRLTYANVMSSIAVFLVLGGASAFAATQLGKNTVGSKQLKKNAVTAAKLKNNAVTSGKIKNNAVTDSKIANGAVTFGKIGAGVVGTGQLAEGSVGTGKLADNAVNSGKIADGAVNGNKLSEAERSVAYVDRASAEVNLPEEYGKPQNFATVLSVNVPQGNWTVDANVTVAIGSAETNRVICRMSQNGAVLAQGGTQGVNNGLIPSIDNVNLTGYTASAGTITVSCADSATGVGAINRTLVATRVGQLVE